MNLMTSVRKEQDFHKEGGSRGGSGSGFKLKRNDSSDSNDEDYGFVSDGDYRPMWVSSGVEEKIVCNDSMSKIMAEEKPLRRDSKKKIMRSRAALREYDTAKPRRVLFEDLREEIKKKNSIVMNVDRSQGSPAEDMGSVLSEKRERQCSLLGERGISERGNFHQPPTGGSSFSPSSC